MSKQIDTTKPLSAEDRKYLEQRGQWQTIALIDREHGTVSAEDDDAATERAGDAGNGGDGGSTPSDPDPTSQEARDAATDDAEWVESLTVDQLRTVIAEKDDSVDLKGLKKPDLQAELLAILEDEEESQK